jgi:hypothetical protein
LEGIGAWGVDRGADGHALSAELHVKESCGVKMLERWKFRYDYDLFLNLPITALTLSTNVITSSDVKLSYNTASK